MRVTRRQPFRFSSITLAILCCSLAQHSALADDGPAVLRFARQYQQQAVPPQGQPAATSSLKRTEHAPKGPSRSSVAEPQRRAALQNQLARSQQQLHERGQQLLNLQQQISQLKRTSGMKPAAQPPVPSLSEADRRTLQNVATTFSNLWHFSPSEAALAEKLRQAHQQVQQSQQRIKRSHQRQQALQQQLNALRDRYTALIRRDAAGSDQQPATAQQQEELEQQIAGLNEVKSKMQQQLADSLLRSKTAEAQLDSVLAQQKNSNSNASKASAVLQADKQAAEEKLKALQARLDEQLALRAKQLAVGKPEVADLTAAQLKQKDTRQAYAIGFSLGHEILQVQAENHNWSAVDSDRRVVLAGIIDAFKNNAKIPLPELEKTLTAVTKQLSSGREKFMNHLDSSTKNFVSAFIKDKNTHKSDLGFWYRIGYIGDTPIPANASIDVVVKESLANGKVVEDMDAKGIVLTQNLSAFPPVFREALSKIKNHGSVTIVVPPKLAYGEKGYPPKVPPNATMVYDIRIAEFYPDNKKTRALPEKKASSNNLPTESGTGLK